MNKKHVVATLETKLNKDVLGMMKLAITEIAITIAEKIKPLAGTWVRESVLIFRANFDLPW